MITRDLFELASLDVLGLLDEDERRDFERAFREAPPALQAQIRREQLRQTEIDDWLPDVQAPASLKPRVLSAVREAIDAVRAGQGREHMARKVGPLAMSLQRNVSPLWRAAAVGFAAATLFAGYQFLKAVDQVRQVTHIVESEDGLAAFNAAGGAGFSRLLLDSGMRSVAFTRTPACSPDSDTRASVVTNDNGASYLYCSLPKTPGGYRLVILSDEGDRVAREVGSFDPAAGMQIIVLKESIPTGSRLAILPQSAGDNLSAAVLLSRA